MAKDLKVRGIVSKLKHLSMGGARGGVPFKQGPLFYMLRNPFYVGKVKYKNEILPGSQPPLIDQELFDAVQAKLTAQWSHRTTTRLASQALVKDLLFDDAGQRKVVTHATKNRVRYRYYVSASCLRGPTDEAVGSVKRVPAKEIELAISKALIAEAGSGAGASNPLELTRDDLDRMITKVEVRKNQLAIHLKRSLVRSTSAQRWMRKIEQHASLNRRCSWSRGRKHQSLEMFFVPQPILPSAKSQLKRGRASH